MRYARAPEEEDGGVGTLPPWEALAVDAVGNVIDFWRFKRNQGRMWALLYLRGKPMSAAEIQEALGLSKASVSMLVRELEGWGVVMRVRTPSVDVWRYAAVTDLMKMIQRVLTDRESSLVESVRDDLKTAQHMASAQGDVPQDVLDRLKRLHQLSVLVDRALKTFLSTARLDVKGALDLLMENTHGRRSHA